MRMARTDVKRKDGEAWFAEEKFGQEVYHAKVGDHKIANAVRCCARSVHESKVLSALGLALSEKQVPRFVVNASS